MKPFIKSLFSFVAVLVFASSNFSIAQLSWNQAGNFPGTVGSHVAVPNSASLNITGPFTLEALINPSATAILGKGIISKGTGLSIRYAMRIFQNRIFILTNSTQRIVSRSSNPIPLNTWTHVAATLDAGGVYKIYINGTLDTSATVAGSNPTAGTDSLYIGTSGLSTEFAGKIDDARVWNSAAGGLQIAAFMKSAMSLSGDGLSNLVLSIPFQNSTGIDGFFSTADHSRSGNNGFARNVTAFDLKNRPSKLHQFNDCATFATSGGAFSAPDDPSVSPTSRLTVECWLYPKSDNYGLLYKGTPPSTAANYGLRVVSGKLNAVINGNVITSSDSVKKERWSHIAFTYFGTTGVYEFFVNGKRGTTGSIAPANIIDGTDSLFLLTFPFDPSFTGFVDEFRISKTVKTIGEINSRMFTSLNEANDNDSYVNVAYNLDASTLPSTADGPRLNMRGSASFTFSGAFNSGLPQSPISNLAGTTFQDGYYMRMPNKRVPQTGTTGIIRDTIDVLTPETITDLNVFVAINHSAENNIKLTLTSPLGASVDFFANTQLSNFAANIVTIFDSDADSTLGNDKYINFGPAVKPQFDLDAIFSGTSSKGKWILTINDEAGTDTGFISGWGLQFSNNTSAAMKLECTSLIEGFYNASSNLLTTDTMTYYLRSTVVPYPIIDSAKAFLNSSGLAYPAFTKAQPLTNYFLVLKHRNSLETWSSSIVSFSQFLNQANYNFSDLQTKAFGDNMKQVDASPVRFALFSGDVNRDGTVDATDVSTIDNDASNFVGGYVVTDLTGDNFVDGTDFALADNNASNFVSVIAP